MNKASIYFQKNKFTIILLSGILLTAMLAYFILWPALNQLQTARADYLAKNKKLTDLIQVSTAIEQKKSEFNLAKQQLDQLSRLVPISLSEDDLIAQISGAASESGVKLATLSFAEATKKTTSKTKANPSLTKAAPSSKLSEVNIPISIDGDYLAIEVFLNRIVKINRLLSIQSITFTPAESSYRATINAKGYINK